MKKLRMNLRLFDDPEPASDPEPAPTLYKIVENTYVSVNGVKTPLQRNMTLEKGPNGAIIGVTCEGEAIDLGAEIIAALVASGAIVEIESESAGE